MSFQLLNADGYIFDFNGTLFWDSRENREAWSIIFSKYRGTALSDEEFATLNGRTDEETVLYLAPDESEMKRIEIAAEKEMIYKELCLSRKISLSPGAEKILSSLKAKGKKLAIASSAPWINMEWYIPEYGLERFFERENIIAGRTDIPSKPDPAIFLLAMKQIGTNPDNTIVFEDSASGVKAALSSGVKLVYRIKEKGLESIDDSKVIEIQSFEDIKEGR